MLYHHRHQHVMSCKARVEHLNLLHQNVPQKINPPGRLDGKLKNHKLVHIAPTKSDKTPTQKCRVCVCEKISRKKLDFSVLSVVFLCIQKAATHDITQ